MERQSYDVVIVGGAMMGASVAWHLACGADFAGRVLIIERDPSFEFASSSHTNSVMRQQFSSKVNIRISQYCAEYIRKFRDHMRDHNAPKIFTHTFGYMVLADNEKVADHLRSVQKLQARLGAGTRILDLDQIAAEFPFYNLDGIVLGSLNQKDEGYFDGGTMGDWWRRKARKAGVDTVQDEVVAIERSGPRVTGVRLKSGRKVSCATLVNAAGPRCTDLAAMAGIDLPIEPRKRYTFVVQAENPLDRDLPLTVDPSGVHVRTDGAYYMVGSPPDDDGPVAVDDFDFDHSIWEAKMWPAIANRIPAFETVKVINSWVGHYAYNRLDQNAVIGMHPALDNMVFVNGFSGHGFQQAPAMGRGVAELIIGGGYERLDLSPLGFERILTGKTLTETAVI